MNVRLIAILLVSSFGYAETYRVTATKFYNSFHNRHPVLQRIKPGDIVITRTLDSSGRDEAGKVAGEASNPLTGPFYIEGAAPGDAIAVTFRKVQLNRNWGWSAYRLGLFSLTSNSVEGIYSNRYKEGAAFEGRANIVPWDLDLKNNTVKLREPASKGPQAGVPAKPMLGCVGVAAAGDFGPNSGISGPYGGNMDYNEIGEGSTVVLPVYHAGALLFVGDGHALQADGEPTGTGIETSMDVEFTVELRTRGAFRTRDSRPRTSSPASAASPSSRARLTAHCRSQRPTWRTGSRRITVWSRGRRTC